MKIALFGYGKMGQLVEQTAQAQGHQICAIFSRERKAHRGDVVQADVAIDFSTGSVVLEHLSQCLSLKKPIIIGTTGWENHTDDARELVLQKKGSCLYAPNFSIGVYLYRQILKCAASLFQSFHDYDACGIETHHRQKKDSPSGTAKAISKDILQSMPRLQAFDFLSVRCGHMMGKHSIQFDSPVDTLTLTHEARSRQGFADGALMAASWLINHTGFFSFEEMMQDVLTTGNR